jgi:sugar-specific transcriptional regulator TrmB
MNKIVVGADGIESVGNLELNQSRTHKHFWLVDKRESLVNRISRTTNDEVKIVLELLRDLYTYLIKADDKFSDNLKFQFEQVEDKLALYPTAEDMKRLHAQISDIISQIQNEVGDELKSDLAVIEKRLSDLESPHRLIISGQNEIIKTREFLIQNWMQ